MRRFYVSTSSMWITLVFTNQLNTAGYVYALAQMGLELRYNYTGPHYAECGA